VRARGACAVGATLGAPAPAVVHADGAAVGELLLQAWTAVTLALLALQQASPAPPRTERLGRGVQPPAPPVPRIDLPAAGGDELRGTPPTPAERRVLERLAGDESLAEIADALFLSRNTVKSHVRRLYRRLGATSRAAAVEVAREAGLLPRLARRG